MDAMVLATQQWLNQTYGDDSRYNVVTEDGQTGWPTIYALTRALQIELGIQNTADSFGPTTQQLYGQNPLQPSSGTSNKYAILQGSLWCKGYDPGHYASQNPGNLLDKHFDDSVANAVISLKTDAGMINPNAIVTTNFMKALLSMDSFKLLSSYGGDTNIRAFQQEMNRTYEAYIGIMPCDGLYGRNTNKALIYALQAEEQLPVSVANGNFGPTTKNCCPQIPYAGVEKSYTGQTYTQAQIARFTKLLNFGLLVNGFHNGSVTSVFSASDVSDFQQHCALPQTGTANLATWMSLMVSSGDTSRPATACDTRFEITSTRLSVLQANGYLQVGRYIVGGDFKEIRPGELQRIFNGGLSVFAIYQKSGTSASYFTAAQGRIDALDAAIAARLHRVPRGETIFFAVDFDAMDVDITNRVLPYFQAIHTYLSGYMVGIYGPRNACIRVGSANYSFRSFVSDMSTGFSGNLGFKLPSDWAFDQIANITISSAGNSLEIDKDVASGNDTGFSVLGPADQYEPAPEGDFSFEDAPSGASYAYVNRSNTDIPVYEDLIHDPNSLHVGGYEVSGDIIGYIHPEDAYTKIQHSASVNVTSFGVIIHASGTIRKGYIETVQADTYPEYPWVQYQEPYHLWNSTGTSLVPSSNNQVIIGGNNYRVFVPQKDLDCYNPDGNRLPIIPRFAQLATNGSSVGKQHPDFMHFGYILYGGDWTPIEKLVDPSSTRGAFIDLGLHYGASPSTRAIR